MEKELENNYFAETGANVRDNLTSLYNHGFLQILINREIQRAQRYGSKFTLALLDIDNFGEYNDKYGPLKADIMLQEIAQLASENIRGTDLAARYVGDVFAIVMPEVYPSQAIVPIKRIQDAVDRLSDHLLTLSAGLTGFPRDAADKNELLSKTEIALERAKSNGQNKIYFFQEEQNMVLVENESRILIVDDEPLNLKLLEALLIGASYRVVKASSGPEALKAVSGSQFDLIILDIMMPRMDGYAVCRRLKAAEDTRMIPVILLTALSDSESRVKGIEAGADDFVSKPPNKMELLARVKSLLKIRKLNKNLTSIESVLFSLANTIEAKDPYTQGHISRVSNIAVSIGRSMGLSSKDIVALRYGGILHDIGKIGVSKEILNKPGPLTDEEWEIMKEHPTIGFNICKPLKNCLGPALEVIRFHHEKLDGSGYPDGRKGNGIPMVARIMAVADIYDALTSDRPYRNGMPKEKALDILNEETKEGKLDAAVVSHLKNLVGKDQEDTQESNKVEPYLSSFI